MRVFCINVGLFFISTQQWSYIKADIAIELHEMKCRFVEILSTFIRYCDSLFF